MNVSDTSEIIPLPGLELGLRKYMDKFGCSFSIFPNITQLAAVETGSTPVEEAMFHFSSRSDMNW
jgi:hypothetical protein